MKSLVIVYLLITVAEGCSLKENPEEMSMEEKMYKAPVVVSASFASLEDVPSDVAAKNAVLRITCIFKSPETINSADIKVFKYQPKNSCSGTTIEVGKEYVFTLEKSMQSNETDMYDLFEGVTLGTAAYEIKDSVLNDTVNVCGLNDFTSPPNGCPQDASCCPNVPDLNPDVCVKSTAATALMTHAILSSLLVYSVLAT